MRDEKRITSDMKPGDVTLEDLCLYDHLRRLEIITTKASDDVACEMFVHYAQQWHTEDNGQQRAGNAYNYIRAIEKDSYHETNGNLLTRSIMRYDFLNCAALAYFGLLPESDFKCTINCKPGDKLTISDIALNVGQRLAMHEGNLVCYLILRPGGDTKERQIHYALIHGTPDQMHSPSYILWHLAFCQDAFSKTELPYSELIGRTPADPGSEVVTLATLPKASLEQLQSVAARIDQIKKGLPTADAIATLSVSDGLLTYAEVVLKQSGLGLTLDQLLAPEARKRLTTLHTNIGPSTLKIA